MFFGKYRQLVLLGLLLLLLTACAKASALTASDSAGGEAAGLLYNPDPFLSDAQIPITVLSYGTSGEGRDLTAYRLGSGENVMVLTFAIHGFEDLYDRDGELLVYTAGRLLEALGQNPEAVLSGDWTVYILPCLNPDGLESGSSADGAGRCTTTGLDASGTLTDTGVDMNRCFPTGFTPLYNARNCTGEQPLSCLEAQALADFICSVQGSGSNVLIDTHGWYQQILMKTQDTPLYTILQTHYPQNVYTYLDGYGYFAAWAREQGWDSCLFEFPNPGSREAFFQEDFAGDYVSMVEDLLENYNG